MELKPISEKVHALLSPSSAHRWLECPASVALSYDVPDKGGSFYAEEGTIAHALAESLLKGGKANLTPDESQFLADNGIKEEELRANVQYYVDFVHSLENENTELFVEQEIDISSVTTEENAVGTSDCCLIDRSTLYVVDLKYGMEKIDAVSNPQLAIYARAAYNFFEMLYDIEKVVMIIVQPRLDWISQWEIEIKDLIALSDCITERAKQCLDLFRNAPPEELAKQCKPSVKACHYCKARGMCVALANYCLTAAGIDIFSQRGDVLMNTTDMASILDRLPLIEKWVSFIKDKSLELMLAGTNIPGYKVVRGKDGHRKWKNAERVFEQLSKYDPDLIAPRELLSPTQIEKLTNGKKPKIDKKDFEALEIERSPGKPNIANADDPRAEYTELSDTDYPDEQVKDVNEEKKR